MNTRNLNIQFLKQSICDKELIKYSKPLETPYCKMQMVTTSNIGIRNHHCSLISSHSENGKISLMTIADVVDLSDDGNHASEILVKELYKWFSGLPHYCIDKTNISSNMLACHLRGVNKKLNIKGKDVLNASLGVVVRGNDETIVFNIGNSHCYSVSDKVTDITGIAENEDFIKGSTKIIKNDYDAIMLTFSDIGNLSDEVFTSIKDLDITDSLSKLINLPINTKQKRLSKRNNMTIALYKNS